MRIIAHLDMDAFFAAVEERERPYLKGLPIAVCTSTSFSVNPKRDSVVEYEEQYRKRSAHPERVEGLSADPQGGVGRGVLSTCNYPARAYGLHSAMPIRRAWELSEAARKKGLPPVMFITPKFHHYGDTSRRIMAIIETYLESKSVSLFEKELPALEQVSVDECFFDLSFAGSFKRAEDIARRIKKEIYRKEKLTSSIGIGPNKLIAKIASDYKKPDGLTVVPQEKVQEFLAPLSVRKIPGIGPKAEETLKRKGIATISQGQKVSEEKLRESFGKWGSDLYRKFRGEDDSEIETVASPAKSIGEQETLPVDSLDMDTLIPYLEREVRDVMRRFKAGGFKTFRTIVLTVRFADFTTRSRSRTLASPVQLSPEESCSGKPLSGTEILIRHVTQMFFPFLDRRENPQRKKIRLVGVRVEKLS
ncbi:MAG: DNA polymerase IV [bacterium]|nr:DNA polymerase IV [bacterium]